MSGDAALVLLTDFLWTAVCLFGLYHGLGIVRHAGRAYAYSSTALGRANSRRQFFLNRRKARLLFAGFSLFTALGGLVITDDLRDLLSDRVVATTAEGLTYRAILIAGMLLMALAMRTDWQVYETWGER